MEKQPLVSTLGEIRSQEKQTKETTASWKYEKGCRNWRGMREVGPKACQLKVWEAEGGKQCPAHERRLSFFPSSPVLGTWAKPIHCCAFL